MAGLTGGLKYRKAPIIFWTKEVFLGKGVGRCPQDLHIDLLGHGLA